MDADALNLNEWSEGHLRRLQASSAKATAASGHDGSRPDISWPLERSSEAGPYDSRVEAELRARTLDLKDNLTSDQERAIGNLTVPMKDMLPGRKRAQSGIALRAWILGQVLSVSVVGTYFLAQGDSRLWRPPFFLTCLSLFHFLEFWIHSKFNLPNATVSAFLLLDNGWPYLVAHASAMIETTITSIYFPEWQDKFTLYWVQKVGFILIVVGQMVRSMAIAKAGTNFNHQVQHKKTDGHELVTDGIYALLRHPSYFGFFWWAIGTQIALANPICFCIYALVLWRFFNRRIHVEEKHLIEFFGKHYIFYRRYTRIGIPFITSRDHPELLAAHDASAAGDKGKAETRPEESKDR